MPRHKCPWAGQFLSLPAQLAGRSILAGLDSTAFRGPPSRHLRVISINQAPKIMSRAPQKELVQITNVLICVYPLHILFWRITPNVGVEQAVPLKVKPALVLSDSYTLIPLID